MKKKCLTCKGKGYVSRKDGSVAERKQWRECDACMGTGEFLTPDNCKDGGHGHCEDVFYKDEPLTICHDCKKVMRRCEVYSRVVGYLRPVNTWNRGKQQEFKDRVTYKLGVKC